MNVIFLDIDGVLNTNGDINLIENTFELNKLKLLIKLSEETNSKIVIISDRRTLESEREMIGRVFYNHGVNIDYLSLKRTHRKRSDEILYYLDNNDVNKHVILDDNDLGYSKNNELRRHFINTYDNGFTNKEYEQAKVIL